MSLETGRKLHGYQREVLPMDEWVIKRVEDIAREEGQPKLVNKTPIFEWAPGVPIDQIVEEDVNNDN